MLKVRIATTRGTFYVSGKTLTPRKGSAQEFATHKDALAACRFFESEHDIRALVIQPSEFM